jgi:hypothetical protein
MVIAGSVAALITGSAFGSTVLASPARQATDSQRSVITFTKWVTGTGKNGDALMAGTVGGDVSGTFSGEVLFRQDTNTGDMTGLEAVYEVQAGDHSFKSIVIGASDNDPNTNHAELDGRVVGGWHAGDRVHVEFRTTQCNPPQPAAVGNTCFQGTIIVTPDHAG